MYNIITKKKHGEELTTKEIEHVVFGYTKGEIPDYQMSALLMAICLNGMNDRETFDLTMAMANSGDLLDLKAIEAVTADKHSTGGVGDKTSLIVAPIAAANGVAMAKMSGRGLGHTGGTIDKLDSIPGFKTALPEERFIENVNKIGMSIISQTGELAPADKKMYALRDVTATVDSIPLIASSIMSKKLAAGAKIIVLDVKCGSGAFMKTFDDAKKLAETMIDIGKRDNRRMYALISDMSQPLGNYVGNRLEVYEAVKTLQNEGPEDLTESCLDLSAMILIGAGKARTIEEGRNIAEETLKSGKAFEVFKSFVAAQDGDVSYIENIEKLLLPTEKIEVKAGKTGMVASIDTEKIGLASMYLGGGRQNKEDDIDPDVGLIVHAKKGDILNAGDRLVTLYVKEGSDVDKATACVTKGYEIVSGCTEKAVKTPHTLAYMDENGIIGKDK